MNIEALLARIKSFWYRLLNRQELDSDLDDEIRSQIELMTDQKIKEGMKPEEARRAATVELGGVEQVKEQVRTARTGAWVDSLAQDIRFGLRILRKRPGFTVVVVLTLALGIGANTAIFTLVHAVMLRSLPVASPEQLYRLGDNNNCCVTTGTQNGGSFTLYSYPLYENLREHTPEFTELSAFSSYLSDLSVRRAGDSAPAQPYKGEFVSGNYFKTFGVSAAAGRTLTANDDKAGATAAAVISYHTWQTRFGSDPSVIGETFTINTTAYIAVGVAPRGFYGDTLRSDPPDFWLPLAMDPDRWLFANDPEWLYLIGRLRPGSEPQQVQARLTVELQQWLWSKGFAEATPEQRNDKGLVERAREEMSRQHIHLVSAPAGVNLLQTDYAAGLRLLVTIAALLLLIACANIANLLLARGSASRSQMAVRVALGAPRRRLIQQLLTESLLLSLIGGAAGLYVAYAGARAILLLAFRGANYVPIDAQPSLPILGFSILLSLVTGIVFGILPACSASQSDPLDALRGAGRSTSDRSSILQKSLVVAQVAFSIALLVVAGLATQSLRNLEDQNFGFATEGRLIVNVAPSLSGYTQDKLGGLYQRLDDTLPRIPGVLSASLSWYSPLGDNSDNERVYIQGKQPDYRGRPPNLDRVGPDYFETIGTRLLRGRVIDERDTPTAPRVAVINEAFARRYFSNEDPLGQHFGMEDVTHSGDFEIVGIVGDAKYQDTRGPAHATFFLPLLQAPPGEPVRGWVNAIELRVMGRPDTIEPNVRRALADVDPNLTILRMMPFGEQVARNFNQERLIARLTELFGALALSLACVGLYGVTAYSIAQRTNEIGIRMALGADRQNVIGLVLRAALAQLGLGLAVGIPVALAGGQLLASQLYGVKSYDPAIIGGAAAVLICCALIAAFVPARRAMLVDPMVALRHE